ncbi:MAG TPA: preprotein translocase subunit SecE [Chloroflexota bacterium]|nr:preprotein translocase subunit SecE [Chloroflexota bacterium]
MRLFSKAPPEPVRAARPVRANKATRTSSPTQIGRNLTAGIGQFFYDTKVEFRKIVWPTREQAVNLTGLVIAVSIAVAAFIGLIDLVLQKFFSLLLGGA